MSKWYQILRGFRKSKNKQILKVTALYLMWNPEICQDSSSWGQDDLFLWVNYGLWKVSKSTSRSWSTSRIMNLNHLKISSQNIIPKYRPKISSQNIVPKYRPKYRSGGDEKDSCLYLQVTFQNQYILWLIKLLYRHRIPLIQSGS